VHKLGGSTFNKTIMIRVPKDILILEIGTIVKFLILHGTSFERGPGSKKTLHPCATQPQPAENQENLATQNIFRPRSRQAELLDSILASGQLGNDDAKN